MSSSAALHSSESPSAVRPRRWLQWTLVVYLILLTYALLSPDPFGWLQTPSTTPSTPLPPYLAWLKNDKVRHVCAYALLAGLLRGATRWNPAMVLLAAAVHGGSMEILQQWFPPRSMELNDWIADVSGALMMLVVQRCLPRRRSD